MHRVALLHTVKSVLESFEPALRAALPTELKVHNLLDEFLASDPAETGVFSEVNKLRLANDLRNAELTGAELAVVTCSTLSPHVEELRASFDMPLVVIDGAMCRLAARRGPRLLLLATAASTLGPTAARLRAEAAAEGLELSLEERLSEEAYLAMRAGRKERHDELVLRLADGAPVCDAVVLAQASMAHLEGRLADRLGLPVFSSPRLCIAEVGALLGCGTR